MKLTTSNKILGGGMLLASLVLLFRRIWLMELDYFEFDDAFMFMRYAENILAGHGYTWNGGEPPLYGNTSILYTYCVAFIKLLFGKLLTNSWVLVLTASLFAIGFIIKLQTGLYHHLQSKYLKNRLAIALITIPFLLLPLIFVFHISTGMETTLSLFLNTVFVFAVLNLSKQNEVQWPKLVLVSGIGYLLFLARPDNAVVVALFPIFLLLVTNRRKILFYYIAVMVIVIGLDSLVKYFVFGDILPLSFYAKKSGFTEGYTAKYFWNPIKYITQMAAYLMPFILLIFAFIDRKKSMWLAAFLLPCIATFIYYFSFDQIMGFNARLYFPFLPYFVIPAILLFDRQIQTYQEDKFIGFNFNTLFTKTIFLVIFLFFMVFSKYKFINQYEAYAIKAGNKNAIKVEDLGNRKYHREASIIKLDQLLKSFPNDFVFAATEHGALSGNNPKKKILDLSGLHNKTIARHGYSEQLLVDNKPDLVWMPHQDLTVLHHQIRSGPYFQENYEYITDVYAFGCAIRKDSKYYNQLIEQIN